MPDRRGQVGSGSDETPTEVVQSPLTDRPTTIWKPPTVWEIVDPTRDPASHSAINTRTIRPFRSSGDKPSVHRNPDPDRHGEPISSDAVPPTFIEALARWRAWNDYSDRLKSGRYECRCPTTKLPKACSFELQEDEYFEI